MTLTEAKALLVKPQSGVYLTAAEVEAILSAMAEDTIEIRAAAQDWQRRAERAEARIGAVRVVLDPAMPAGGAVLRTRGGAEVRLVNIANDSPNPASAPADPLPPSKGVVLGEGDHIGNSGLANNAGSNPAPGFSAATEGSAPSAVTSDVAPVVPNTGRSPLAESYPQYMERVFRSEDARTAHKDTEATGERVAAGDVSTAEGPRTGGHSVPASPRAEDRQTMPDGERLAEGGPPTPAGAANFICSPGCSLIGTPHTICVCPPPARAPRKRKAPALSTAIQCGGPDCTLAGNVEHHKPSSCPRFTKAKEPSDAS